MTSPGNLGGVEVEVDLTVRDVGSRLRRALRGPAERVGSEMERQWRRSGQRGGAAYSAALREAVRRSKVSGGADSVSYSGWRQAGAEAGQAYTSGLEQALDSEIGPSFGQRMAGVAKTASLAAGAVAGIGFASVGREAFSAATGLQRVEAALSGMYGSAEKTEYMMSQLRNQFSESSVGTVDMFAQVAQSLAWVGSSGDEAITIMKNLETALLVAGGGAEELESVGDALASIANQGQATANELDQISSTGLPIWDMLAAKIGGDVPDAMQKVTEGAIDIQDVLGALEGAGGDFFAQMDKAAEQSSQTFEAAWQRSKNTVINAFSDMMKGGLDQYGPAVESAADDIAEAMERLPDVVDGLKNRLDRSGVPEFFSDTLLPAVQEVAPVFQELAETGFEQLVNTAELLVPPLSDLAQSVLPALSSIVQAIPIETLAKEFEIIVDVLDPVISGITGLNDALDGFPAKIAAAAAALATLRSAATKLNLRRSLRSGTAGTGAVVSEALDREIKTAEGTAKRGGRRIGEKLKTGFSGFVKRAGFVGLGVGIANDIVEGFTGVDVVDQLGNQISEGLEQVREHGFEGLFKPTDESIERSMGLIDFFADSDNDMSILDRVRQQLANISFESQEARSEIQDLIRAASTGDDEALQKLRGSLDQIEGGSKDADSYLRRLLRAAEEEGDYSGLKAINKHLNEMSGREEKLLGFVEELINGFENIPETKSLPEALGLDELGEQAEMAGPSIKDLEGALDGLGESSGRAAQGGDLLGNYLDGLEPASYSAQQGFDGLSFALEGFQSSTRGAASSAHSMSDSVSGAMSATTQSFGSGLTTLSNQSMSVWQQIVSIVASSMSQQQSSVLGGMQALNAAQRSGWGSMESGARTGVNNVAGVVRGLQGRLTSALGGLSNSFYSTGVSSMQGLAQGIQQGSWSAISQAESVARRAAEATRRAAQILSPSRVFAEIGEQMGEGLAQGIRSTRGRVGVAGSDLAISAAGGAGGARFSMGSTPAGVGVAQPVPSRSVTVNQTITSPSADPRAVGAMVDSRLRAAVSRVV